MFILFDEFKIVYCKMGCMDKEIQKNWNLGFFDMVF